MVRSLLIGIIDDDEVLCSTLVDLMRSSGHRAEPFSSAETFLASPSLPLLDCLIADVAMPGMSGLELVRKLREQGGTIPVVLMTALPDKDLDNEAISVGAQCLLRKAFDGGTLLDSIEKSLADDRPVR
jgi:FixJ family two-component response regulator